VTNRPYRDALTEEEAVAVIDAGAGAQFDPDVVEAFHRWREVSAGDRSDLQGGLA